MYRLCQTVLVVKAVAGPPPPMPVKVAVVDVRDAQRREVAAWI